MLTNLPNIIINNKACYKPIVKIDNVKSTAYFINIDKTNFRDSKCMAIQFNDFYRH